MDWLRFDVGGLREGDVGWSWERCWTAAGGTGMFTSMTFLLYSTVLKGQPQRSFLECLPTSLYHL